MNKGVFVVIFLALLNEVIATESSEKVLSDRTQWVYTLGSAAVLVAIVGLSPLIYWVLAREKLLKLNNFLICFGGGAILSLIFTDLIVEVEESIGISWKSSAIILGAYFISAFGTFGLGKDEECCENHKESTEMNTMSGNAENLEANVQENQVTQHNQKIWGQLVTVGDAFCNFSDGIIIAGAYSACGIDTGITTSLAILSHEVTHEVGDFAILLDSGFTFTEGLLINMCTACMTFIGVIVGNVIIMYSDDHDIVGYFLSFGIGIMLFVVTNVLPRAIRSKTKTESMQKSFALLCGMAITTFLLSLHSEC